MNPTLINYHKKRYDWALNAKEEFINQFVRLKIESGSTSSQKELTISVYGPSQVGKTTVILSLLGLKEEKIGQLSKWLRGKRKLGESSTVTVMRYERSYNNSFHIYLPNQDAITNLTGEELEMSLQSLRSKVETQKSYSIQPVVVEIPKNYFVDSKVKFNIIDLPGVESAELKEVEHVNQCIKYWIPLSEVCLLVDDATQMTAFTQYTIGDIKNWYNHLGNFRIIPTRALSLENVRKKIQKGEIQSANDLVKDYSSVLNRVLETDLDLVNTIYPIDTGKSWEKLCEIEPMLYGKMKRIIQQILNNLKKDLESVEISEVSFSRLSKLYKETEEASKLELQMIKKEIDNLEQVTSQRKLLKIIETDLNQEKLLYLNNEKKEYSCFRHLLGHAIKKYSMSNINNIIRSHFKFDTSNRKASNLNKFAESLQKYVEEDMEDNILKIKNKMQYLNIYQGGVVILPPLDQIKFIKKNIDNYLFRNSYEKDFFKLEEIAKNWLEQASDDFISLLRPIEKFVIEKNEELTESIKANELKNKIIMRELQQEIEENMRELKQLRIDHKIANEQWKQDVEHAKQLQRYFIKHWLLYKKELEWDLVYGTNESRWFATQYLQLLHQDGKRIIHSLNLKGEN